MDEIIPGLWLGDLPSAQNVQLLKKNHVSSILTVFKGPVTLPETFIKLQIPVNDTRHDNILVHFLPAALFIQEQLDNSKSVLVHCVAGISRSPTIIAAYLMYTQKINHDDALNLIKDRRPIVDPNPGFISQLKLFYDSSFSPSETDKATRMYYIDQASEEMMNSRRTAWKARVAKTGSEVSDAPRRKIRCKMCRYELATKEDMLDHSLDDPSRQHSPSLLNNPKCSGYFVEPLKWMDLLLESGHVSAKITCPNPRCPAKLGNYDWTGVLCGCGQWVTPAFCINRSKVDELT